MSIPGTYLTYTFGLRTCVPGGLVFQDEHTIVYPCGSNLVCYNMEQRLQRFINGLKKSEGMTAMAISPNRRFVALAERSEKAVINIYDLHSMKKAITLVAFCNYFTSLSFSADSKYLISQGSEPDWKMFYWEWEKGRFLATIKTSNVPTSQVIQIAFNPRDSSQICIVGDGFCKLYRYFDLENCLKQSGKMEANCNYQFTCMAWVSTYRVVACTENGVWILMEEGEIKASFTIDYIPNTQSLNSTKEDVHENENDIGENDDGDQKSAPMIPNPICSIVAFRRGFGIGCRGLVHWFRPANPSGSGERLSHTPYERSHTILLPADSHSADPRMASNQLITHLAVSPQGECLIAGTNHHQLYYFALAGFDLVPPGGLCYFQVLSAQSFHDGRVVGIDLCMRKPLIASCSNDRSVRIWNFESK